MEVEAIEEYQRRAKAEKKHRGGMKMSDSDTELKTPVMMKRLYCKSEMCFGIPAYRVHDAHTGKDVGDFCYRHAAHQVTILENEQLTREEREQ